MKLIPVGWKMAVITESGILKLRYGRTLGASVGAISVIKALLMSSATIIV